MTSRTNLPGNEDASRTDSSDNVNIPNNDDQQPNQRREPTPPPVPPSTPPLQPQQEQGDSLQNENNSGTIITVTTESAEKVGLQLENKGSKRGIPSDVSNNDENQNNQENSSISSIGSYICRICQSSDNPQRMISPCECRGTLAYVHRNCLEYWLSRSGLTHCELCMHRFEAHSSLRYGLFESIRIWYSHPNHRGLLQSDLFVCSMLTLITFSLIMIIVFGLQYFAMQSKEMGLPKLWTESSLIIFLTIVLLAYTVNVYIIFREHFSPWFRWWRSARRVELLLTNNV